MKNFKKIIALLLALMLCIALCGCGKTQEPADDAETPDDLPQTSENGQTGTQTEFTVTVPGSEPVFECEDGTLELLKQLAQPYTGIAYEFSSPEQLSDSVKLFCALTSGYVLLKPTDDYMYSSMTEDEAAYAITQYLGPDARLSDGFYNKEDDFFKFDHANGLILVPVYGFEDEDMFFTFACVATAQGWELWYLELGAEYYEKAMESGDFSEPAWEDIKASAATMNRCVFEFTDNKQGGYWLTGYRVVKP